MFFKRAEPRMPSLEEALPGRPNKMDINEKHHVLGRAMEPPFAEGIACIQFGMGCFWGAEKKFWGLPGVHVTAVGYAAGYTENPTYREVCSGLTGHNEVVLVAYHPSVIAVDSLLKTFWENHDPTQGMRQGNDVGTQYRSGIYWYDEQQRVAAEKSLHAYSAALGEQGFDSITTEVLMAAPFYYAEVYHQQYLSKNPMGYCGLGGTGVSCPTGLTVEESPTSAK